MIRHLFFDLDRTLWDFEVNSKKALNKCYEHFNLSTIFSHFIQFHSIYSTINNDLWKKYGKGKITKDALRIERFRKTLAKVNCLDSELSEKLNIYYVDNAPKETQLFPNTKITLEELKKNYRLHIITNGFQEAQFDKLKNAGIFNYFTTIVCSEMVGKNKPHIEIFKYAMNTANATPNESIMIGDDLLVDIIGAIQSGMQGVLFDPNDKYIKSKHQQKIKNIAELPYLLTTYPIN